MTQQTHLPRALLEEAALWAHKRADHNYGDADEKALAEWLSTSPLHRAALDQIEMGWLHLAESAAEPELIAMRSTALDHARRANRARWRARPLFNYRRFCAVAALLLLCVIGAGFVRPYIPRVYETGIGEREVVALSDGSRISLDADTRVRVRLLDARRELWLERGRAKFDVAHDPLRPFSVRAGQRTVIATGTAFSVELVDREFRVVLYEGSVAVLENAASRRSAPLKVGERLAAEALVPGQELVASIAPGAQGAANAIDTVRSRAWEGGQLVFENEELSIAVARVNRYAKKPIALDPSLGDVLRVSGVFNAGDTEAFLEGLSALAPLRVSEREGNIWLSSDRGSHISE